MNLALLASILLLGGISPAAAAVEKPWPLQPGQPVERPLAGGETHDYTVQLERGQFLRVVIDQRGIDVVTVLDDPAGREILHVDSELGIWGTETLCFIAGRRGSHRIRAKALESDIAPGRYELRVAVLRQATASDRLRAQATASLGRAHSLAKESFADFSQRVEESYRAAARLWHEAQEPREEGNARDGYGTFLRNRGDLRGSLVQYEKTLALARRVGDRHLEAAALESLGSVRSLLGDPQGGLVPLDSAIALSRILKNDQREADSLVAKGWALYLLGRYQEALDCQRPALKLAQSIRDRGVQAWAGNGLGNSYAALGESFQALRAFDNSCNLFRQTQNKPGLSFCLQSEGFLSWQVGASRKALSLYQEALPLAVASGNRAIEALIRNNIGLTLLTLGDLEAARTELARALELWTMTGDLQGEALSLHNLGKVQELLGDGRLGLETYGRALTAFRRSGDRGGEARVLATIAYGEAECGRPDEALVHIGESLAIFDALGRQAATPRRRGSFLALRQNAYAIAVDVLARLDAERPDRGFAAKAFAASERARARTLLESLTEARLDLSRELPEDLRARQADLGTRLAQLQKELASTPDKKGAEENLARAEEEWEGLIGEMRRRTPRYAAIRYPEPVSLERARRVLDRDTALVSYSVTPDSVLVFVVTADKLDLSHLSVSPSTLAELVENYVGLISRDDRNGWESLSHRLYVDLVSGWRGRLAPGIRRLIIVPDRVLHSLPFETLSPTGLSARRLVEDFVVSYAPSATVLAELGKLSGVASGSAADILVLANPTLPRALARGGEVVDGEAFDLSPLPHAAGEAAMVARFGGTGSELDVGADASERRVKDRPLERFGVIHFATHALLAREPSRSAFLLAAKEGERENGLLSAREIYQLKLRSDLVVLSACQTGRGRILPGEGVQGLAQAFFHAGARSVVASLWNVSDRRTAELMGALYRHLSQGEPKSEALRAAKLDLLRREPRLAPRYWAPFVLIGEPYGKVPLQRPSWWRRLFEQGS